MNSIEVYIKSGSKTKWQAVLNPRIPHLQKLLSSLQNHLLAYYTLSPKEITRDKNILDNHLRHLFPLAAEVFKKSAVILDSYFASYELLYNVLLDSLAGAMLLKVFNSLLLMPGSYMKHMLNELLNLLEPLNKLNRLLPTEIQNDNEYNVSGK